MATNTALLARDVEAMLKNLPQWKLVGKEIVRTFSFKNYHETMAFVNATAWISHRTDHHPDLEVSYNTCKVRYSTHSAGGVTESDFDCAREVDQLLAESRR